MNKFLVETVLPALGSILAALVPLAVWELKKFIAAKTKNEQLRGVLDRLADAASDVVRDVSATTYKELSARAKDGQLTPEDREYLRGVAVKRLREVATKEIVDLAKLNGLDVVQMTTTLQGKIEAAVDEMKLAHVAAANAVPVAPVAGA